jgi:hypothetical protein
VIRAHFSETHSVEAPAHGRTEIEREVTHGATLSS